MARIVDSNHELTFNTPLEMPNGAGAVGAGPATEPFQYSIGDAEQHPERHKKNSPVSFQYSIGDARDGNSRGVAGP